MKKTLLLLLALPCLTFGQRENAERAAKRAAAQYEFIARPAASPQGAVCLPVDVPYSENFNSATVPALPDCTSIENAGTGNDFTTAAVPGYGFTSQVLRYHWHDSSAANAWFFTRGINMNAGTTYNISYKYGSAGANVYTEKLKVHIGTSASVAGMGAVPLIDHPLVNNNVTPITDNLQFTPSVSGVYYVGFNCYSNPDQFYLFIDDILVSTNLAVAQQQPAQLSFSPNPVRDVLHVSATSELKTVSIYNLQGQRVREQALSGISGDVSFSGMAGGAYLVEVLTDTGRKTMKVVKE